MDSYRGHFTDRADAYDPLELEDELIDLGDDDIALQPPPSPVGQDERRMQVRAYNYWASLLGNRAFPALEDHDPAAFPELAPYSVLLDFEEGIENPRVTYIGEKLAEECGTEPPIRRLADIPARSLLSRITDHYMQILANEVPIGFEAEFVNQRNRTIVYRGILLPFSRDGVTIQHIMGVINWKELADQATTEALFAEIDAALKDGGAGGIAGWADGPGAVEAAVAAAAEADVAPEAEAEGADVLDLSRFGDMDYPDLLLPDAPLPEKPLPLPDFGSRGEEDDGGEPENLADWLASAQALAIAARMAEDRSHAALYVAIGRAWDFALAAGEAPEELAALLAAAGLTGQARAPLLPIVKLVFGADYDKTRLTEYASVLGHAARVGLGRGSLAGYLAQAPGGLKGIVQAERRLKREAAGEAPVRTGPRKGLARKLRKLEAKPLAAFAEGGEEFALLLARRLENGEIVLLGEAAGDVALVEKAAKRLLG